MERRTLGRTGLSVSALGFGGAPIGLLDVEQNRAAEVLDVLLDGGVNVIDTAAGYRGSEEALGRALGARRDACVLISKCGQAFDGLPGAAWSAEVIAATVDRSLRRLRTDRLDVMLLHSCGMDVLERGEALGALVRAKEAGKVRFAGYSGDNEEGTYAAGLPDVDVIETSVSICDQANLDGAVRVAREGNKGVIAKRPIANTAWRNPADLKGFYQGYARDYHARFGAMKLDLEQLGLAGREWADIALRFTLAQPGVHTAIVGVSTPEHARANVAAMADPAPLSADVVGAIRAAYIEARQASASGWPALG